MKERKEQRKSFNSLNLKGIEKLKKSQSIQSARSPKITSFPKQSSFGLISGETSVLAKHPRNRTKRSFSSTDSHKTSSLDKIILESQFITLLNERHLALKNNKELRFNHDELELIGNYCRQYSLLDNDILHKVCQERPLTPYLYQQILNHLRQGQQKARFELEDNYNEQYTKYLTWFDACHIKSVPDEPDFSKLSKSEHQQQRLLLIWRLVSKQVYHAKSESFIELLMEDFAYALNGFCHLSEPSELIHEINKLIPFMNRKQIGIAQIIVFHLAYHRADSFNESARRSFRHFCQSITKKERKLKKCGAYFGPEIKEFVQNCQDYYQSTISRNIKYLASWFQNILLDTEPMSFMKLFLDGIDSHGKLKDRIASEIAVELFNATSYFYQLIPLTALLDSKRNSSIKKQFDLYFDTFTNGLRQFLVKLDDNKFASAIHLLVKVGQHLTNSPSSGSFADFYSLMMLTAIFESYDVSKKLKLCSKILDKDRLFITKLATQLSLSNHSKEHRRLAATFDDHLPFSGILYSDLTFAKDGNPDMCLRIAAQGKIIEGIHLIQQKLSRETIFFNTSLLREVANGNEWTDLKHEIEEITWQGRISFEENISKIEHALKENKLPVIKHRENIISCESLSAFLWKQYVLQLEQTDSGNEGVDIKMVDRLEKLTNIFMQKHYEAEQPHIHTLLNDKTTRKDSGKQKASPLVSLSRFGSFRFERGNTQEFNEEQVPSVENVSLR